MHSRYKFTIQLVVSCPLLNFLEISATMQRIGSGYTPLYLLVPCPYDGCNIHGTHQGFPNASDTVTVVVNPIYFVVGFTIVIDV